MPAKTSKPEPLNLRQSKKYQAYQRCDESEQHEIIKQKLTGLNWVLADKALDAAHNATETEYAKLVQLCTALGISYDKAFGKREITVRPLSFPEPLQQMVRKGLLLGNAPASQRIPSVEPLETKLADGEPEGGGSGVGCSAISQAGAGSTAATPGLNESEIISNQEKVMPEVVVAPILTKREKVAAIKRKQYARWDKQARLDKATALRQQRMRDRKAMVERARMEIAASIPWQNTLPIDQGVL
jgi:hypothetical protein